MNVVIKKTLALISLMLLTHDLFSQDSNVELPLIGDRLSGAVSQTQEEILGRQFLRDLKERVKNIVRSNCSGMDRTVHLQNW